MAGGWSRDGAVQEQIDASIDDAVRSARQQIAGGQSNTHCERCDEEIPKARQEALTGVRCCVACQIELDKSKVSGGANRRANKDSMLR